MNPDTLILAAALALAIGCALLTRFTEPGGLARTPLVVLAARTARGLAYHHAGGRHAKPRQTGALTTIPDALTIARTA